MKYFLTIFFICLIINCSNQSNNQINENSNNQIDSLNKNSNQININTSIPDKVSEEIINSPKMTPLETIKDLDKKVEAFKTGPKLTQEDVERNRKIKSEIIRGVFDIKELCMRALGSHWKKLNDQQQSEFVQLMTRLLERKAIFSKEQVKSNDKPYTIDYKTEKFLNPEKTQARVATQVKTSKYNLKIEYELIQNPTGGWKVYDVIVDDASLMKNYQFQFNAIIQKNGYDELVSRMQNKLDNLQ